MSKISVSLIALSALLALVLCQPKNPGGGPGPGKGPGPGHGPKFDAIFCDKSLSATKLAAIQNCQQFVPADMSNNTNTCLTSPAVGVTTSFQDFRNTICNLNGKGEAFKTCMDKNLANLRKSGPPSSDARQMFKKHGDCMQKAMQTS